MLNHVNHEKVVKGFIRRVDFGAVYPNPWVSTGGREHHDIGKLSSDEDSVLPLVRVEESTHRLCHGQAELRAEFPTSPRPRRRIATPFLLSDHQIFGSHRVDLEWGR